MKNMTLRNIPEELAEELERERQRRGKSLNQVAIDLMKQALGIGEPRRSNGLGKLAASWSVEELREFEAATAQLEQIDQELWS